MRTAFAAAVAPFPAAFVQSVMVALWPKEGMGAFEHPASMFVVICLFYYIFGLLIGVPAWLIARKRKPVSLRAWLFIGLLVGVLPVAAALAWMAIRGEATAFVAAYNLAFFGFCGLVAGWTFRTIRPRPRSPVPERVFA